MTQIRVSSGAIYEVHTTANWPEKHSHIVMVGRGDTSKIIGVVARMVTWGAILETPEGLKPLGAEFQYRQQAIAALVHAWDSQAWELARKKIRVIS